MPGYASVIDAGLQKLYDYHKRMSAVDAYTLAICTYLSFYLFYPTSFLLVLHPERKLEWFRRNAPDEVAEAEDLFLNYVRISINHSLGQCSFYSQLHQYRIDAGIQTPRRPQYLTSLDWADEVLGDTLPAPTIGMRGLASEVDAYFGEGQVRATSPLAFWQVRHFFHRDLSTYIDTGFIGKPAPLSNDIPTCHGYPSHPGIISSLRARFFLCKRDRNSQTKSD